MLAQRVVALPTKGVATAIDLLCLDAVDRTLWAVEVKCVSAPVPRTRRARAHSHTPRAPRRGGRARRSSAR